MVRQKKSTMYWQGTEWAVPIFEMVVVVLPIYVFVTLYRRVKRGVLNKSGALWRYSTLVIIPTILYVLFFFALVGIEELTHIGLVAEGLGRSFLILVGLGIAIWFVSTLVFSTALLFLRNPTS